MREDLIEKAFRDIRRKITSGYYPVGWKLMSYPDMREYYSLSYYECVKVINRLVASGRIEDTNSGRFVLKKKRRRRSLP